MRRSANYKGEGARGEGPRQINNSHIFEGFTYTKMLLLTCVLSDPVLEATGGVFHASITYGMGQYLRKYPRAPQTLLPFRSVGNIEYSDLCKPRNYISCQIARVQRYRKNPKLPKHTKARFSDSVFSHRESCGLVYGAGGVLSHLRDVIST